MITPLYIFESALLRAQKHSKNNKIYQHLTTLLMYDASHQLSLNSKEVIFASSDADQALSSYKGINRLFQLPYNNLKETRRKVAKYFVEKNQYQLN